MAMLAETRRKQNFVLQPRGKPLYEDTNSFGSRMLSKMGWEPGKGLGAKEDGNVDFIKIKYKKDVEGMGYEARDDHWTVHENGFNQLLKDLSNHNSIENSEEEKSSDVEKYQFTGQSLEKKSKTSRARVHYKKFTKSKDLSQYSEKDLANIFGKKSGDKVKTEIIVNTPPVEDDDKETSTNSSYLIINSKISSKDYFKNKMKSKLENNSVENENPNQVEEIEISEVTEEVSKKKMSKKKKKLEEEQLENNNSETIVEEKVIQVPKKNKKKKKDKESISETNSNTEEGLDNPNVEEETTELPKKNKKKKKDKEPILETNLNVEEVSELPKKNKKKKKDKEIKEELEQVNTTIITEEEEEVTEVPTKNKKKKKDKELIPEVLETKNSKKRKSEITENEIIPEIKKSKKKETKPINLRELEMNFNRERHEYIITYLRDCRKCLSKTVLRFHPIQAELLRNANLEGFKNSNLGTILGYQLTNDVDIKIMDLKCNIEQLLREQINKRTVD